LKPTLTILVGIPLALIWLAVAALAAAMIPYLVIAAVSEGTTAIPDTQDELFLLAMLAGVWIALKAWGWLKSLGGPSRRVVTAGSHPASASEAAGSSVHQRDRASSPTLDDGSLYPSQGMARERMDQLLNSGVPDDVSFIQTHKPTGTRPRARDSQQCLI
jgi:hypothetical protein